MPLLLDQVDTSILRGMPADEHRQALTLSRDHWFQRSSAGAGRCFVLSLYSHSYLSAGSKDWLQWGEADVLRLRF